MCYITQATNSCKIFSMGSVMVMNVTFGVTSILTQKHNRDRVHCVGIVKVMLVWRVHDASKAAESFLPMKHSKSTLSLSECDPKTSYHSSCSRGEEEAVVLFHVHFSMTWLLFPVLFWRMSLGTGDMRGLVNPFSLAIRIRAERNDGCVDGVALGTRGHLVQPFLRTQHHCSGGSGGCLLLHGIADEIVYGRFLGLLRSGSMFSRLQERGTCDKFMPTPIPTPKFTLEHVHTHARTHTHIHTHMLNNITVSKTYKCIDLVKGVVGEFGDIFTDVAKTSLLSHVNLRPPHDGHKYTIYLGACHLNTCL